MKNYLIYFLFFTTVVFSQNYQYSLEEGKIPPPVILPTGVNNQLQEIEYFKAYLLPISQKANLQKALDTYGAVRLGAGDYRGVAVTLTTNQRLYGNPILTQLTSVTINAGSSGVVIENLLQTPIIFQAGGVISNCMINTIKYSDIIATNAMLENNLFLNISGRINFDCSTSGYFRNNRIIKHQAQSIGHMLVMKGNDITPSYGNVNLHSNYLSSNGDTTDITNLDSATFIGIDCETYEGITRDLFYAKDIGKLNLALTQGGIYFTTPFAYYNIDATTANFIDALGNGNGMGASIVSPRTKMVDLSSQNVPVRSSGTITGFDLRTNFDTNALAFNGTKQSTTITDPTTVSTISNSILGTQYTPWARPTWETLPDPLGSTWASNRIGKTDSTAYIQNLIDTNGFANLPEGVFYISSTLNLLNDYKHGILGSGTGKTVICGLTDDFPLIKVEEANSFGNFILSNLTLQGGSVGLLMTGKTTFIAYQTLKFLVFRNQTYGVQVHQTNALDNNFFDNISFVNCTKGFFQDPLRPQVDSLEGTSYIDKTLFYNSQFLNCGTALDMNATRPNNMDAWVNCKFDTGAIAFTGGGNSGFFANCDFSNYNGEFLIDTNGVRMFSCNVFNNKSSTCTFRCVQGILEGCTISDSANLFISNPNQSINYSISNSTIKGNVLTTGYHPKKATFVNSTLLSNPTISKLLVNIANSITTVIIDGIPNPYPQLLVTQ